VGGQFVGGDASRCRIVPNLLGAQLLDRTIEFACIVQTYSLRESAFARGGNRDRWGRRNGCGWWRDGSGWRDGRRRGPWGRRRNYASGQRQEKEGRQHERGRAATHLGCVRVPRYQAIR
jgi:hypothetical protein